MKRWITKGGVLVIETDRRVETQGKHAGGIKIHAIKADTGGFHGWLWLKHLRPAPKRRRSCVTR